MSSRRPHRSIGEVLALLQDEFPDITISKIRFLESQGLIDPERTPSGYRKFFDDDIDLLRWILRQQREHFLPLKVIKARLDEAGGEIPEPPTPAPATSVGAGGGGHEPASPGPVTAAPAISEPEASEPEPGVEALAAGADPVPADSVTPVPRPVEPAVPRSRFDLSPASVSLTAAELASAAGLTPDDVVELERFGLIGGRMVGSTAVYGDDALVVARLAAAFKGHGIEARHLRMYQVAAQREAGVFEQVVSPLVRQRSAGRTAAAARLEELAELGDGLRDAMLRRALGDLLL